ncbi:MAG: LEPR-XLL domain-containing protein, partial [Tepidisphaeraceae bacterium]
MSIVHPRGMGGRRSRRAECHLIKAVVEALEPRILLSTYTVENLYDVPSTSPNYANSLRWAINSADAAGGNNTIAFASGLSGTISLDGSALELDDPSGTLTIDGPGAGLLSINAIHESSVFTVDQYTSAAISDLTITDGYT